MLLTAGCSFVWGDELEGFDNNPPTHWGLTFTSIVARKLGIDYANRGVCGASNDKIFREVTDFLHSHPDKDKVTHIVVMWSAWQRKELAEYMPPERDVKIGRQNDVTQFSQLRTELIYDRDKRECMSNWFDTAYDSKTDIMHTLSKMKTLEVIAEAKGIKLIQGVFHNRNWSNIMSIITDKLPDDSAGKIKQEHNRIDAMPEYKKWLVTSLGGLKDTSRVGMGRGRDLYTIGKDLDDIREHGHPGEETQRVFSKFLLETFEKSNENNI